MFHKLILEAVPNAKFVLHGIPTTATEYAANLEWLDDRPKPTWKQLQDAKPAFEAAQAKAERDAVRRVAYTQQADPLFFKWQRGEATEQEWLDAVAAVRAAHPDPEVAT